MIDESVLQYEKDLNALMGPMGIKATVLERESCYYMVVDGSKLYPTAAQWKEKIGRTFEDFATVFIPGMFMDMEKVMLNETSAEFKIGTIFDMMMRVKEYGDE